MPMSTPMRTGTSAQGRRHGARFTDHPWLVAAALALVASYGGTAHAAEEAWDNDAEVEVEFAEWNDYWAWEDDWADDNYVDADDDGIYEAYDYDYEYDDYDYDYVYDSDYGWTDNDYDDVDDVEYEADEGWHEQEWYDPSDWGDWDDDFDDDWDW